jgi:hypothetical protein
MREVTLNDINQKLSSQMKVDESISRGIHGLREDFQKLYGLQEQAIRQAAEAKREGSTGSKEGGAPTPAKNDAKKGTNFLSKGLGDMLGKMTGGIMKGAMGLAAMGIAIPAFFGGLLAGDAALTFMKSIGADFNFKGLKAAALGFSDMIMSMDPKSFIVLAGIMGISAVGGIKGAKGLGSMGIAISAFLGGLLVGDAIIGGASSMGWIDLNFSGLKGAMSGFSDMIMSLDPAAVAVLGVLLTAGGVGGALAKKPTDVALGVASLGAGISGFFIGLAIGDKAMGWLNSDFGNIAKATKGFSNAISNMTIEAMGALGLILGTGMILGKITDEKTKMKMVLGIGALSAGIAAFFLGFAATDFIAANVGTGEHAVELVKNFGAAIGALDQNSLIALGGLLAAGAIFGATGLGGPAALGMGMIGAGIAAFFLAFEGLAAIGNVIGADGSNTKTLITNMASGLKELTGLDGDMLLKLGEALPKIGLGVAAFFAGDALGSITQGVKDAFNFLFGTESENKFAKMVEELKPLEGLNDLKIDSFGDILSDLERFAALDFDGGMGNKFSGFANSLYRAMPKLETAFYGGKAHRGAVRKTIKGLVNAEGAIDQLERLDNISNGRGGGLRGQGPKQNDMTPVPVTIAGGAPIIVQDNSSQVAGGTTVMAGETRPSTANDRVMKTGFMQPVY